MNLKGGDILNILEVLVQHQNTICYVVGVVCGAIVTYKIVSKLRDKSHVFVKHIEGHLKPDEHVVCKICDLSIDQIYDIHQKNQQIEHDKRKQKIRSFLQR